MAWLLDTNAWIHYWKNPQGVFVRRLLSKQPKDIVLCSVVLAEILLGAEKYGNKERRLNVIEETFEGLESFPFDDFAAEYYALIRHNLEIKGTRIGPNDLMIAAIARSRGFVLVTSNIGEFSRVEGLRVEDWTLPEN